MIKDLECQLFDGFKNKRGYGYKYDKRIKKMKLAHRLVYELDKKIFLKRSEVIMHICDNPSCINICHLRLGSQKENLKDCRDKKRHMHGDSHTSARIDMKKAMIIRRIYKSGSASENELSLLSGLNQSSVHDLVSGKTWKVEPIEKCKHPSEKVKGTIYGLSRQTSVFECECGARVKPASFEVCE